MVEYIKKEDVLKLLEKNIITKKITLADGIFIYDSVKNAPTADVVEVVRCKDCAHYIEMKGFDYKGRKARSCVWHSALRRENDYCSDAIRTPKERGGEK